jgi:glycosyltransferase involved in cell wall biosynthesis
MSQRPLRITIVLGPFYPTPPAPTGAVQRLWYDLGVRFARKGHHVTVLAKRADGQAPEETVDGVRIVRRTAMRQGANVKLDILRDAWYSLRMAALMSPADILVTNAFWSPVLARLQGKRVGKTYVSVGRYPKGQMFLYRRADRIHVCTSAIREAVLAEIPDAEARTRVVPYPILTDVFVPPAPGREFSGPRTLLYTGRVHPEKGVHLLVEAWARLRARHPDVRLKLVGPPSVADGAGGDDYVARLRTLAGPGDGVEFVPAIYDRKALAACLQQAHLYCYPSLAEKGETFGIAPLEAMATGLPTVVSGLKCFTDFLTHGRNGLAFDHRDADPVARLAEALGRFADDPAFSRVCGDAAAATARGFGYDQVADLYIDDFRRVMAE